MKPIELAPGPPSEAGQPVSSTKEALTDETVRKAIDELKAEGAQGHRRELAPSASTTTTPRKRCAGSWWTPGSPRPAATRSPSCTA